MKQNNGCLILISSLCCLFLSLLIVFSAAGPQMPAGLQPAAGMMLGVPGMVGMQPALIPGLRQPYLAAPG